MAKDRVWPLPSVYAHWYQWTHQVSPEIMRSKLLIRDRRQYSVPVQHTLCQTAADCLLWSRQPLHYWLLRCLTYSIEMLAINIEVCLEQLMRRWRIHVPRIGPMNCGVQNSFRKRNTSSPVFSTQWATVFGTAPTRAALEQGFTRDRLIRAFPRQIGDATARLQK
jgi:hypothetical protein